MTWNPATRQSEPNNHGWQCTSNANSIESRTLCGEP
ncbi:MAG: hypothetical protein F4W96_03375 [Chloroflexi bacterium]|nr:hypothetical protein [Chloroflexota bacterium]